MGVEDAAAVAVAWLAARARHAQDVAGVPCVARGTGPARCVRDPARPAHWEATHVFDPNRFLTATVDGDAHVPQGGGDVVTGHRCPGEGVVVTLLGVAVRRLAELPHTLPPQDLDFDLTEMPTRPRSGVVLVVEGTAEQAADGVGRP